MILHICPLGVPSVQYVKGERRRRKERWREERGGGGRSRREERGGGGGGGGGRRGGGRRRRRREEEEGGERGRRRRRRRREESEGKWKKGRVKNGKKKREGMKEMNRERRKTGGGEGAYIAIESVVNSLKVSFSDVNSYAVCNHTHQSWVPSSCYGYWRVGFSHTAADAHLLEWDTCLCCKFDTAGGDQGSTGLHRLDCGGGGEGKRVRQGRGGGG